MEKIHSVKELVRSIESKYDNPHALNRKEEDKWIATSHKEMMHEVRAIALWLMELGLQPGDRVGILALPSPRWTIIDLAAMSVGLVTVPLFGNISEENFVFECAQTGLETIFVGGEQEWTMWSKHKDLFSRSVAIDETPLSNHILPYQSVIDDGDFLLSKKANAFESALERIHPDDPATIIYTSGSTGIPKGVVLSHKSILALAHVDIMSWQTDTDRYLSILPLAHVFGRSLNFIMLAWGIPVFYFNDPKNVGIACREVRPTAIALVPRLLEKIYAKMVSNIESAGFLKRTVQHWAFSLANEEHEGLYQTLMHTLADKIVYSHIRDALGGALRVVISGGAPLNPHLCHFFIDVGLPIYEGYGLTEAAIVAANNRENRKIGTVGKVLDTVEVKLSPQGEIMVKGDVVMSGYWKNPKATAETLTADGWLFTGDKGVIDPEGYISIVGRNKELFKSSVGEYIAPVPIEQQLSKAPIVDLAMIVAEQRKYVSCLIFPNFDVVKDLKRAADKAELTDEEFLNSLYIKNQMDALIESVNRHVNHWEQIHAYHFVMTPPTIEGGELTPSMKIRRENVAQKYKSLIDSMYPEEATL